MSVYQQQQLVLPFKHASRHPRIHALKLVIHTNESFQWADASIRRWPTPDKGHQEIERVPNYMLLNLSITYLSERVVDYWNVTANDLIFLLIWSCIWIWHCYISKYYWWCGQIRLEFYQQRKWKDSWKLVLGDLGKFQRHKYLNTQPKSNNNEKYQKMRVLHK